MSQDIQAPENASPETQEILKELEAEGHQIEDQPTVEEPKEEPRPEQVEEPKEEPKPEPKVERTEKFVPVGKHNEERHKRQEAERLAEEARQEAAALRAKLAETTAKPVGEQLDEIDKSSKTLAEKHGLEPDFVKDLLEESTRLTTKRGLSKEVEADIAAIKELKAQADQSAREAAQETGFSKEFDKVVQEFPDLAARKEELKQLAFSEGNINTSLRRLALEYLHDNTPAPGRKSSEAPTQGKGNATVIDFSELSEEDFKKLSYDEVELYEKWLEKKK